MQYLAYKTMCVFFLFALPCYSLGQNGCSISSISNYFGKWVRGVDENINPTADLRQVRERVNKIQKLVQAAVPELARVDIHWNFNMQARPLVKAGPVPYELSIGVFVTYCDTIKHKVVPEDETGTFVWVNVNAFGWFLQELDNITTENWPIYLLPVQTGDFKGLPLYEGKPLESNAVPTEYSRTIVIFRKGDLPYVPVTKKEYLVAFINYYEKLKAKEKAKREAKQKLNNRTSMSELEADNLAISDFDDIIQPAKDELQNIGDEGDNVAYLEENYTEQFAGFAKKAKGRMLVRLKTSYLKKEVSNYAPQMFVIRCEWENLKPTIHWQEQLEENLDIAALQNMLDK